LAINLLGKIAQEMNLSLLASFGNESDSFRDILMQRLEFKSEDIHLKVVFRLLQQILNAFHCVSKELKKVLLSQIAILDFWQNGIIEHFLLDENLVERLLELVNQAV